MRGVLGHVECQITLLSREFHLEIKALTTEQLGFYLVGAQLKVEYVVPPHQLN
jgi:hypothetical protein